MYGHMAVCGRLPALADTTKNLVLYISEKETDRSVSKLNWLNVISFFQAQPRGLHLQLPDEDSYAP